MVSTTIPLGSTLFRNIVHTRSVPPSPYSELKEYENKLLVWDIRKSRCYGHYHTIHTAVLHCCLTTGAKSIQRALDAINVFNTAGVVRYCIVAFSNIVARLEKVSIHQYIDTFSKPRVLNNKIYTFNSILKIKL